MGRLPGPGCGPERVPATLDNAIRRGLYEAISNEPGVVPEELGPRFGLHASTINYHLGVLERAALIVVSGAKRRVLFVIGSAMGLRERELAAACRGPTARGIVRVVADRPGIRQAELGRVVRKSESTIAFHLRRLADVGAVSVDHVAGASKTVWPTPFVRQWLTKTGWDVSAPRAGVPEPPTPGRPGGLA